MGLDLHNIMIAAQIGRDQLTPCGSRSIMRLAHSAAPILRPASLAAGMTKTLRKKAVLSRFLPFMLQLRRTRPPAHHRVIDGPCTSCDRSAFNERLISTFFQRS